MGWLGRRRRSCPWSLSFACGRPAAVPRSLFGVDEKSCLPAGDTDVGPTGLRRTRELAGPALTARVRPH